MIATTEQTISERTGFDQGEPFVDEQQVRAYFTAEAQREMFGADAITDQAQLAEWAELVIANRWHFAEITLDTPLASVEWDNAAGIGEDLIDTSIAGDEWGLAWSRVLRAGGTVRDLRDALYGRES